MIYNRTESVNEVKKKENPTTNIGCGRLQPIVLTKFINSMIKVNFKTVLKFGAAVLVGAVVFIGSTAGDSSEKSMDCKKRIDDDTSGDPPHDRTIIKKDGLRTVQNAMMKTSEFITTLMTVCDSISRLFMADTHPRYSSSTLVL